MTCQGEIYVYVRAEDNDSPPHVVAACNDPAETDCGFWTEHDTDWQDWGVSSTDMMKYNLMHKAHTQGRT